MSSNSELSITKLPITKNLFNQTFKYKFTSYSIDTQLKLLENIEKISCDKCKGQLKYHNRCRSCDRKKCLTLNNCCEKYCINCIIKHHPEHEFKIKSSGVYLSISYINYKGKVQCCKELNIKKSITSIEGIKKLLSDYIL